MKNIIVGVVIFAGIVALYWSQDARLDAYNKHMCAVYGYYEDCSTPLPVEKRLK